MATEGPACRVILIGMMGSGKTTIGHLMSSATGWAYVDNDELVQRRCGTTSRKIMARQGEAKLRQAETSALALGLELPAPVIIGVAAGTILDPANRHRMEAGGIVVWLRARARGVDSGLPRCGGAIIGVSDACTRAPRTRQFSKDVRSAARFNT